MSTETQINEEEVVGRGGLGAWRFANGLICRGSEDKGTLETRDQIAGRLRRVGVFDKTYDNGNRVYQLEADVENTGGIVRVAASLIDMEGKEKATGVLLGLTWSLLQIAKDEGCIFTAGKSREKNKYGSYSTFVNAFTLADGAKQGREVPRRGRSDEPMDVTFDRLLEELKAHPAWADRPQSEARDSDGDPKTHLAALCDECAAKGWPTPEQAPGPWLGMMAKAYKLDAPKSSLSSHSDDEWGAIRQGLLKVEKMPEALAQATQTVGAQTAAQAPTQPDLAGIV